jgi:hypothetical protein
MAQWIFETIRRERIVTAEGWSRRGRAQGYAWQGTVSLFTHLTEKNTLCNQETSEGMCNL